MATFDFEFESKKAEVEKAFEEAAQRILTYWGMAAEKFAKRLAPVDTGLMRNSITWAIEGGEANIHEYTDKKKKKKGFYEGQAPNEHGSTPRSVYIGTNVEYAKFQELGSYEHKVGRSPFLRPAIEDHTKHFKTIYEGELKDTIL